MTKQSPIRTTVANLIADRLAESDKTQREIATECGFENANAIAMLANGSIKVPLDRIGLLAKAIDADPAHLLRLALIEYLPDTWIEIENVMQSTVLTANELALVRAYREVTGDNDTPAVVIDGSAVIAVIAA